MTCKWTIFEKKQHSGKWSFDISKLFIQCNKASCCEHIRVGVNIYGRVSLLAPECTVCLFMCVFLYVTSNQSTSKKPHHALDFSKFDAWFHKTLIKVLRLDMCTSIISLSKIKLWCDPPISQRNKTTEWAMGVEVGGGRKGWRVGVWTKFEKGWVGNIGRGLHKIGGLGPLCQLCI